MSMHAKSIKIFKLKIRSNACLVTFFKWSVLKQRGTKYKKKKYSAPTQCTGIVEVQMKKILFIVWCNPRASRS